MTIRFISIFFFFLLSVFHWYKRKSCRNTNIEGYFHFSSKWQLVLCQLFRYVCFTGQMSENLSTVIKSCRANFGVKWRVFFSTSIFVQKCQFWTKIIEVLWEMLTFWNYCALLLKVDILLENMLIFRKFWLFVWMSLYIKKLYMIKTSIFLRKCLFVHVLISLENCYFD